MLPLFPTDSQSIFQRIKQVDPIKYGKTRNYLNGSVTYLSPYISRGLISTRQVLESVLNKGYGLYQIETFVKELCWRDYFQRVGQFKDLNQDIRQPQPGVSNHAIPQSVIQAKTEIEGIDKSIQQLYQSGYMHNHVRMYTASLVCNVAQSYWKNPSQWMYYHLLDGDWASNTCSWQWVAGANSGKKYYANQENINKFTGTNQFHTILDVHYSEIENMPVPESLLQTENFQAVTIFPSSSSIIIDEDLPTFIYNYYNLDPSWHKNELGNRVLFIDTDFFQLHPVSPKCMDFMLALSENIPNIQIFVGNLGELVRITKGSIWYYKEHPLNQSYKGVEEQREWIAPDVTGYFPSFFGYWKQVEKSIKKNYSQSLKG